MQLKRRMVVFLVAVLLISNPVGSASSTSSSQNSRPRIAKKRPPQTVRDRRGDQDTLAGTRRSTAAMLWEAPGRIEELNMVYGSGGRADAPDPGGRYKFIRKLGKGYSTKYVVADDQGKKWVVKFGEEAKSETAASRIVWAMGYHTDPAYFVKSARISGVNGRKGMVALNVRFEEYRQGWKDMGHWSWEKNPFRGTRELQGLKVLMAFLNNWDLKRSNNTILCPEDGEGRCIYFVSDLGATFGKTGSLASKVFFFLPLARGSRGVAKDYAGQKLVDKVKNGRVDFNYKGKNPSALDDVTVRDAQWMGDQLSRLSDKQIADTFRASGFNDREVAIYTRAFRQRVRQLRNLE